MKVFLSPGDLFDTPYEKGCKVITSPDEFGAFLAIDSDGIECWFSTQMVVTK